MTPNDSQPDQGEFVFPEKVSPDAYPPGDSGPRYNVPNPPSRIREDVTDEEMDAAIRRHCARSTEQTNQLVASMTPEEREKFINRAPAPIRESLRRIFPSL